MKVYIARDCWEFSKANNDGIAFLFWEQPTFDKEKGIFKPQLKNAEVELADGTFPEIKNGECYSAEITLGEKV